MARFFPFPSSHQRSPRDRDYRQLPADADQNASPKKVHPFRRRHTQIALASVVLFLGAVGLWLRLFLTGAVGIPKPILYALAKDSKLPPLYSRFHQYELSLPQHHLDPASPNAAETQYFWIANHMTRNGWGNAMQELLLNSYLAYHANRSFVFNNFTWDEGVSDYSIYNLKPIPSRIPLTALIRGPTVGGPFPPGDHAPLAVMKEFWDTTCQNPTVIDNNAVVATWGGEDPTSQAIVDKWIGLLDASHDRCVEVAKDPRQLFDIWLLQDGNRLLDLWPAFSQSPILRHFRWSDLVELAFDTNREVFAPSNTVESNLMSVPDNVPSPERYTVIPGLLALHIRRGDFIRHCKRLAGWNANFVGYNAFPSLPDRELRPADLDPGALDELYRVRCFPEIDEIVRKVENVRSTEAGRGMQHLYIMTNAPADWILELKAALQHVGTWENIASSRDILVNKEQEYVKQAVDMLIGQRAQVFIGNGFSSLTGQVTMLRMANNFPAASNRLW